MEHPSLLPDSPPHQGEDNSVRSVAWWIVMFLSLFQTLHFISDKAISWLIQFLYVLMKYLGTFSPQVAQIAEKIPRSLYIMKNKHLGIDFNDITRYVVCTSCHSLYLYNECTERIGSQIKPKQCLHKTFSRVCNYNLVKEVVSCSGNIKLYPSKVYCYKSVISSLQKLLLRPGFSDLCESTRNFHLEESGMTDVYNGQIWKDFLNYGGKNFLLAPYCYAVLLNIDWFQPFEHFTYSVGVIYLVILNLPRSIRYKRENIILVGIIPGPSEPPLTINTYLAPMVSDLLRLWSGIPLKISGSSQMVVKVALLGLSCDLPAGRKVAGFLSFSANLGCSRCYCSFSEGFGQQNYSNVDRPSWKLRSNEKHRADVQSLRGCRTKTERNSMESKLGCRYSELLELPYFDPVRMVLIDPMHNLFLGTAKYVTKNIWIGADILGRAELNIINERLTSFQLPVFIGRVPSKIDSGATFTAEQWMNWTIYFSIYCLYGILSTDQFECWRHFVLACRRLCKRNITPSDVAIADGLLWLFVKRVKLLYGEKFITPNMHMQCHLSSCVRDFGPLHSFWLFAFERYNGLLGNQPNNNRAVEIQLMTRFVKDNFQLELLHQNSTEFLCLYDVFGPVISDVAKSFDSTKTTSTVTGTSATFIEPPKYTLKVLHQACVDVLKLVYSKLYPEYEAMIRDNKFTVLSSVKRYSHLTMNGTKLSSMSDGLQAKVPYVLAKPVFPFHGSTEYDIRPAQIQYFVQHSFCPSTDCSSAIPYKTHSFAFVQWPEIHPHRHLMGKPVELWCKNSFENYNTNQFLPLENIISRVIAATHRMNQEETLVIIPIL